VRVEIVFRPGLDPFDRQWLEEQLEEAFAKDGLGEVVGGGTAVSGAGSDIAVDVHPPGSGISVILGVLRRERVPRGTRVIEQGKKRAIHQAYNRWHPYVAPEGPAAGAAAGGEEPRGADLPRLGDTYVVPLRGKLFGACRVLGTRAGKYATLAVGTNWFGEAPPRLSERKLRSLLVHTCVGATVPSCRFWLAGRPPDDFRFLGVIEPSPEEQRLAHWYGQHTENWRMLARSLLMEWDWLRKGEE
jgi:hypothetical protein